MNPLVPTPYPTTPLPSLEASGLLGEVGPPNDGASERESAQPYRARQPQILLVEDDRGIREVLRGVILEEGYAVTATDNGRAALDLLRSGCAADLIVLDLRMPVMDGWEFRAEQKSDPSLAGIPVVAVSADGSAKAAAIDAEAYLRKPLRSSDLLSTIGRVLAEVERRRLFDRLQEAQRFAALGRLAANIGHEINNPLAYVTMNVELALRQFQHASENRRGGFAQDDLELIPELLSECRVGLDHVRDVVKDLRRLSRRSELDRDVVSMNDLLDESLAVVRSQIEYRATVRKQYGHIPSLAGDRSALAQVLFNLLLNASRSIPEGRPESNEVLLRTYSKGAEVVLEIRDTGAGIPPRVLPHVFDPLFTDWPAGAGTDLGLPVCARIITDHGGRIEAESSVGEGSTFRIFLPASASSATPSREETAVPSPEETRGRILVIDDLPVIGQVIAAVLTEYDVVVLRNEEEAFERFRAGETFDAILYDVDLPGKGGRALIEGLTNEWPHLLPQLVLMAGTPTSFEQRDLLDRCAQRRLTKPFSVGDLRAVVRAQLRDRAQHRS